MNKSDIFLEEARLGTRNAALIEHDEKPHLPIVRARYGAYCHVDLAHAVMMVEEDILDGERGGKLLEGLLEIQRLGPAGFPWVPESGSCLVQFEHFLTVRHGEDVAGRLQTGRSRNDQEGAVERLHQRDILLGDIGRMLALERELIALAGRHTHTLMPGYTHFQHAQPGTLAHYLMRQAYVFERDLQRLRGAFARANLSALGGAAQAGTSWPIDRRRTCALLGHDDIVVNSSDAGAFARDHIEETVAVLALMMSNLGRLATDLYVWSAWEFSMVAVDDGLAGTSSIMPQKKNPHALERVKALAGQAAGWVPTVIACQRGVLSTDLDAVYGEDTVEAARAACRDALALMTETVRTLIVDERVMASRADAFWSTTTHLADEIVRRFDLPFRAAHHVVGAFVKASIEAGRKVSDASGDMLDEAAEAMAGVRLGIGDDELRDLLDGRRFIEGCVTEGSVNPVQVEAQIVDVSGRIDAHDRWHGETSGRIEAALCTLHERAQELST